MVKYKKASKKLDCICLTVREVWEKVGRAYGVFGKFYLKSTCL